MHTTVSGIFFDKYTFCSQFITTWNLYWVGEFPHKEARRNFPDSAYAFGLSHYNLLTYNRAHELDQITVGRGRPVVVLDGVDECGDGDMLARLLELVLHLDKLLRKS